MLPRTAGSGSPYPDHFLAFPPSTFKSSDHSESHPFGFLFSSDGFRGDDAVPRGKLIFEGDALVPRS